MILALYLTAAAILAAGGTAIVALLRDTNKGRKEWPLDTTTHLKTEVNGEVQGIVPMSEYDHKITGLRAGMNEIKITACNSQGRVPTAYGDMLSQQERMAQFKEGELL